ncbi:PIN domain-containing protein [Pyrodictium abyssi]|uniref:PIN domain-containing protein n=1 Tax=Pyrodictium abyssi TaxID=54256 RepID=A0ABM8IZ40_9CREN|nr:hypothetical protein PABY_23840 [Pyrodictium abyssi]
MKKGLVGIDTNILVHALIVQDEAKHEAAKRLLRDIVEHGDRYILSYQVIGELYSTMLRIAPSLMEEAIALARLLARRLRLIHYTASELENATRTSTPKRFWDTVLALTYRRHGATLILAENTQDFRGLIQAMNPFTGEEA